MEEEEEVVDPHKNINKPSSQNVILPKKKQNVNTHLEKKINSIKAVTCTFIGEDKNDDVYDFIAMLTEAFPMFSEEDLNDRDKYVILQCLLRGKASNMVLTKSLELYNGVRRPQMTSGQDKLALVDGFMRFKTKLSRDL